MINAKFGKNTETGKGVVLISQEDAIEPLRLMRALKAAYPDLWQKVNIELIRPMTGALDEALTKNADD